VRGHRDLRRSAIAWPRRGEAAQNNSKWEQRTVREIPNARSIGFDACGHVVNLAHPTRVNALLRELLNGPRHAA